MGISSVLRRAGFLKRHRIGSHYFIPEWELHRLWEENHLERLFGYLDVDCVLDVGAHRGEYGRMLREQLRWSGQIVSFEPNPEARQALIEAARDDARWRVEPTALGASDGSCSFNIMAGSQFSSLSEPCHEHSGDMFREHNRVLRSVPVQVESLSTAYARVARELQTRRPFLKLDTQGLDRDIMSGGSDVLGRFVGIQCEMSVVRIYERSADFRDIVSLLQGHGFALSGIVPNNAGHFPVLVEVDGIFIRRDLAAAGR